MPTLYCTGILPIVYDKWYYHRQGINEPLIGAGILVKGVGRGTITDMDGKYSLEVKRGETLGSRMSVIKVQRCDNQPTHAQHQPDRF